jgi:hypothetical protein
VVDYAKPATPSEFTEGVKKIKELGNEFFASYDIDRNLIRIAFSSSRERRVDYILLSPVFFYLEKVEYDRFKNEVAELLPYLFAKTGHMW